jgi:acetyl-CoA carboxylase carboxyltransferase component
VTGLFSVGDRFNIANSKSTVSSSILDNNDFFELQPDYAKNIVIG